MNSPPVWIAAAFAATVVYVTAVSVCLEAAWNAWCNRQVRQYCDGR